MSADLRESIRRTALLLLEPGLPTSTEQVLNDHLALCLAAERELIGPGGADNGVPTYPGWFTNTPYKTGRSPVSEEVGVPGGKYPSGTVSETVPTNAPWYPDDSGDWVEVPDGLMRMPPALSSNAKVSVLFASWRMRKAWHSQPVLTANQWTWDLPSEDITRIVAYKVVQP